MKRFLGLLFLILGVLFLFRMLFSSWLLFLLLAAGLALGAATGAVERWGYTAAVILLLLAIPGLLLRSVFLSLAIMAKLGPILFLLFGLYLLSGR